MTDYRPTHVSTDDGAPAMMVTTNGQLCIMQNENGDQWPDLLEDWRPIPEADEQARQFRAQHYNISDYEAERWRAMSDELLGQMTRLKQLCIGGTRSEWQAIGLIESASSKLFGAFGAIMMERYRGDER